MCQKISFYDQPKFFLLIIEINFLTKFQAKLYLLRKILKKHVNDSQNKYIQKLRIFTITAILFLIILNYTTTQKRKYQIKFN